MHDYSVKHPDNLRPRHPHKSRAHLDDMFVISVISNPVRYQRRYELYERFSRMCACAGIKLITVEMAFGDREHMVTDRSNECHLQLRSIEELWHKENMIDLGVAHARRLWPHSKRFAWVDADCAPTREPRDWFEETWHELQHYKVVQMWEEMIDLDHYFKTMSGAQPSFMANYIKHGTPNPVEFAQIQAKADCYPYGSTIFGRPGLAWAWNLDAYDEVGGMIDWAILGAGDWYMAHGLVGSMSIPASQCHGHYAKKLLTWQERCERWIRRDVGYVRGAVYHYFHGRKKNRHYGTRGQILIDNNYDPTTDIKYDSQGLLQLETWEPRQMKMRDQVRGYFRSRDEDCIYSGR